MKDSKIKILLGLLGGIGVLFILATMFLGNFSNPTGITIRAENASDAIIEFEEVYVDDVGYLYDDKIAVNYSYIIDNFIDGSDKVIQKKELKKELTSLFSERLTSEIKTYCKSGTYSDKKYDLLVGHIGKIEKTLPSFDGLSALRSLKNDELRYSKTSKSLLSTLIGKMNSETSRFSASYSWGNSQIRDWLMSNFNAISTTSYVKLNPSIPTVVSQCNAEYKSWNTKRSELKDQYIDVAGIKNARNTGNPVDAIAKYRPCQQFSDSSLRDECKKIKDRAFVDFMGCGVVGSEELRGTEDIDCLQLRKYECVKLQNDEVYYKRCAKFTKG